VEVQRLLIGEGRPVAVGFLRHFNTLFPKPGAPMRTLAEPAGSAQGSVRRKA
jgi:hypothetical protein